MAINKGWMHNKSGEIAFGLGLFWGAAGGAVGSYCASPFFMIRTQLQSQTAKQIAVGYQHEYSGMISALKEIYGKPGIYGLWRDSMATIPHAAGSGVQIVTIGKTKELLREYDIVRQATCNSFCAGLIAGTILSLAITPPNF